MKASAGALVSVVVPAYNGQQVIARTINSVLQQTYKSHEIIVVDDGSTDATLEVLDGFSSQIAVIKQQNLGTMAARNRGAKHGSGAYLAFLDQDDWWAPRKLETQIRALGADPSIGMVFGNLEAVDERGKSLGFMTNLREYCRSPSLDDLLLIFPLYPSSATLRKDLFDRVGGFDTRFCLSGAYGDQDFHIRLRQLERFRFLDMKAGYYSWDEYRPGRIQNFLTNLPIFAEKYYNNTLLTDPRKSGLRERFIRKCGDHMNYHLRRLLEQRGNVADADLLFQANSCHRRLKAIFQDSYVKAAGLAALDPESLNLEEYALEPALCTLLYLYLCRRELQGLFPEVFRGDLRRLFGWADSVAAGTHLDVDREILTLFKTDFETCARSGTVAKRTTLSDLASRMTGRGIVLGIRPNTLQLPLAEEVVYVDISIDGKIGQNDRGARLVPGKRMRSDSGSPIARDSSLDFIVVAVILGHLSDTLAAFHEWHRCLKPSGYLLLEVPDKRFTANRDRPSTTIKHVLEDWAGNADEPRGSQRPVTHEHLWTDMDFEVLINYITRFQRPFTLVDFVQASPRNEDFLCLLQKPRQGVAKTSGRRRIREADFVDLLDLISQYKREIGERDELIWDLQFRLRSTLFELGEIRRSLAYKVMRFCSSQVDRAFPDGTRRGQLRKIAIVSLQTVEEEGFGSFTAKAVRSIRERNFRAR